MIGHQTPWWLPGGHLQTIWSARCARRRHHPPRPLQREEWDTPDGDCVVVDFQLASHGARPALVMFHGLEGSSDSHYGESFADWAYEHDIHWLMPHFRGCGGIHNRRPRAYHSGDHEEIHWMLHRARQWHRAQGGRVMVAAGISLGGNALMRWAGEHGQQARLSVDAVAAICSPLDLTRSGHAMGRGFNRQVYTRMFLRTMKPKALDKLKQYPDLFPRQKLLAARDLHAFDDVFTAPLHGFVDANDYWHKASAKPRLRHIRLPALLLNARNDPFVPVASLPGPQDVSDCVTLWQPTHGGHAGFATGPWPGHLRGLPDAVGAWLLQAAQNAKSEVGHG